MSHLLQYYSIMKNQSSGSRGNELTWELAKYMNKIDNLTEEALSECG